MTTTLQFRNVLQVYSLLWNQLGILKVCQFKIKTAAIMEIFNLRMSTTYLLLNPVCMHLLQESQTSATRRYKMY